MSGIKTILVTGGAGFVGSHCVVKLLQSNYEVVVVDNLSNAFKAENAQVPEVLLRCEMLAGKGIKYHTCDIVDSFQLCKIFFKYKIDCVIHFAALKSVNESVSIPLSYYHNNIMGTISLLQVMEKFNCKKIIYSSSSTVYGTPKYLPLDEKHETGQGCASPYGKTKYFVEEILKDLCISNKCWKVISLRYFNPVGAHESGRIGEDPKGIPNNLMPYVSQVAVGRRPKVMVYGKDYDTPDGTGVRDYIHIQDLAEGHVAALRKIFDDNSPAGFKPYNLGTGSGHSVLQVIEAYKEASGRNIPYQITDRREGDIASSYCDASLAKKDLGWVATKDLLDMCKDSWKWQESNPNGYETKACL